MTRLVRSGFAALAAAAILAACGASTPTTTPVPIPEVETPSPSPSSTSPTLPPSAAPVSQPPIETSPSPMETTMPIPFSLTSPAFADGAPIPKQYTCDGANVSPTLTWEGVPDGAAALALIVDDPDAPGRTFTHWVAFDIDGAPTGGLAEGVSGTSAAPPEGRNDFGKIGYGGPCPPSGTHHYRFQLFALDRRLDLTGTPTAARLREAIAGHVLGQTVLVGTYRR